jgi:hypothetical protein
VPKVRRCRHEAAGGLGACSNELHEHSKSVISIDEAVPDPLNNYTEEAIPAACHGSAEGGIHVRQDVSGDFKCGARCFAHAVEVCDAIEQQANVPNPLKAPRSGAALPSNPDA